ncbi:MAG TPA: ferrochelatase [Terriglobales bacterium]|nr:ferrochelatase [Terriglobales bacterium]
MLPSMTYDAILLVSFGGPEKTEDVLPFLENVLRGRNVPRERMLEVAEHYYHFGGKSPINDQNRALIQALLAELKAHGVLLPVYWGNRNWHPMLADTLRQMKRDGIRRALAFVTASYSSYSSCRQYRENIEAARAAAGEGAPAIEKIRAYFNHPGFVNAVLDRVRVALEKLAPEQRSDVHICYTAHSIPTSMADGCKYVEQLTEASRLVSERLGRSGDPLVFQSRSGPPTQRWLEPDILDHLKAVHAQGKKNVVIVPIGFVSDHMEIIYDLDIQAREMCDQLGLTMVRAETVGTHPWFVRMIRELVEERIHKWERRPALGLLGPSHDVCPLDCCPAPAMRARP